MSEIDYQSLEEAIEVARLDQNWAGLKQNLQEYAHVFDRTQEVATQFHANLKEIKCHYWVCFAEYTFHVNGDFTASIDCLRRASAFNYSNFEIRILIVRFFLLACRPTITKYQEFHSNQIKNNKTLTNFDESNLQLYLYLGDFAKVSCSN